MMFYSMLNCEKILPNMLCRFSDDLFALKKCRFLHIENLTINKRNSCIKLLMNMKYGMKNGISNINFEI